MEDFERVSPIKSRLIDWVGFLQGPLLVITFQIGMQHIASPQLLTDAKGVSGG